MTSTTQPKTLNEHIKSIITDGLTALSDASTTSTIAPCNLHAFLFNNDDPHIIYTHDAYTLLDDIGTLAAVGKVQSFEMEHFGKVHTPLHDPRQLVNMCLYIVGYDLLEIMFCDCPIYSERWDEPMTHDDARTMLDIAKRYFTDYPNTPQDVWDVLPLPTVWA